MISRFLNLSNDFSQGFIFSPTEVCIWVCFLEKNTPDFAKDTVYRFMKIVQINWMRFTTILASRIINNAILPLDSEDRANVLIIDDSMFERNRSTMPCLHFWKLLKKLQFQQNMFFLTAGFHLQFSRCIGTYSSAISLRKWFDQSVNSCYGFIVNFM